MRQLRHTFPLLGALAAIALLPSAASASVPQVFCVNAVNCPGGGVKTTLAAALSSAKATAGPAEIYLGPQAENAPYTGPFDYTDSTAGNWVHINGQGRPAITTAKAASTALTLRGQTDNRVQSVDFVVPSFDNVAGLLID